MTRRGLIVDLFAGGGGASTGLLRATGRHPDIAVNHNPSAIAMHEANHPQTKHLCASVWEVDPREVCGRPKTEQIALAGNSVCPDVAAALASANLAVSAPSRPPRPRPVFELAAGDAA